MPDEHHEDVWCALVGLGFLAVAALEVLTLRTQIWQDGNEAVVLLGLNIVIGLLLVGDVVHRHHWW